jgi:TrmH family RNA methyltransferase
MTVPRRITARDNPLLVRLRKLAQEPTAYRQLGIVWLEGEHLCAALRARGLAAAQALLSESGWQQPALRDLAGWAPQATVVPDALFKGLGTLQSPARIGFVIDLPAAPAVDPKAATIVLDRVQDPGNVGSILRSASAFGVAQVLALEGTAALWSAKVLRAAQGAHFGLTLVERLDRAALDLMQVPLLATDAHAGESLPDADLPWPCAWTFGHEGQGVDAALAARAQRRVRIPQPGGEESLNVAAAAAVCLFECARRRLQ